MGYIFWRGPRREGDKWVTCSKCNSAGVDYSRDCEPTDRAHLGGETPAMAYRGYLPTNLCPACEGAGGYWRPQRRPWRNHRRWPNEADRERNGNVISEIQFWHDDKNRWLPAITQEMREGYVCEFADDVTAPAEEVSQ